MEKTEQKSSEPLLATVKIEPPDLNGSKEVQQCQLQTTSNEEELEQRIECTTDSQDTELRSFLSKCVFCGKNFGAIDDPKLLECLHAACSGCITNKLSDHNTSVDVDVVLESHVIVCHICNVTSHAENLIENKFLAKLGEDELIIEEEKDEDEKKCTSCHDDATATSWCVECEEFICQNCVMAHQRLKITKDHTIKPKNEVAVDEENGKKNPKKQTGYLFCTVHQQEQLTLFCQTCDRLTCRDCQLTDHRDHKYKFIHEIALETRTSVSTLLKEVSYKRVLLKSAMKVIEDRQILILEKKKSLVQDITQMVVQLTNAINTRGKQLVMRLNEVCDQKQNTLNEKKVALDQLSKLTDHCIQFVTNALEKGSDMALLYSKKSVTGHLQRIKSRRADIPNPEIPVRIHLCLEKVPDLIKVVSSIGAVVVDGRVYPSVSPSSGPNTSSISFNDQDPKSSLPTPVTDTIPALVPTTQQGTLPQYQHPLYIQQQPHMGHYSQHGLPSRSSPQTQTQRVPYTLNMSRSQQQQQPLQLRGMPGCQQQVTSSTHPHQQLHLDHLSQNASLRGLLAHNPTPFRAGVPSLPYRPPPSYRYPASNPQRAPSYQPGVRMQSAPGSSFTQHPSFSIQQQQARWHIPQNPCVPSYYSIRPTAPATTTMAAPANDAYKITLKNQNHTQKAPGNPTENAGQSSGSSVGHTVSSSVPKTPSPVSSKTDDTEKSLDKFCQKSLNDLMLTIAKLDSNGIVVIPEAQRNQLDGSQVDSSTDEGVNSLGDNTSDNSKNPGACMPKDDPNEDWCAVCMDGGDAVLCCDKCPKVFHLYCHIPKLKSFPDESETWQCMLCTNVLDCSEDPPLEKRPNCMTPRELRIAQRIVLELYCQYEQSLPFREVVSPDMVEYHRIIKKPIALDIIRDKLTPDHPNHYTDLRQVMSDIRLMFKNAFTYNPVESLVYQEARNLEEFFEKLLLKWAPSYAYDDPFLTAEGDEEEEVFPPNRKYRRIIND
ncbi:E3 ubiquitin-protein ligase TRIM33 [Cephus cinctus]|uniref:E3 ubiquitin-protein ligase TRIM33 n=1 Tax=Cephus cinctus TaxID=211228 RepID=A0AAJ7BXI5_CEPCN|nr:E3 ubiquitin-protein ligase TRIM33 [Cephus cinctus]